MDSDLDPDDTLGTVDDAMLDSVEREGMKEED